MCCEQFTIADLSLAMLLNRLNALGMAEYFWQRDRPLVSAYYQRVSERDAFRRALPLLVTRTVASTMQSSFWSKLSSAQMIGVATILSASVLLVSSIVAVK